jgi:protein SCO1/2
MRILFAALLLGILVGGTAAHAALSHTALQEVYAEPIANAQLPLDLTFIDESDASLTLEQALDHRPALLVFADYTCTNLCGPILAFAAAALEQSGLRPGLDYRLVIIGIDAKDGPDAARAMKRSRIGVDTRIAAATVALTGASSNIRAIAAATGYHYTYDSEHDQFAHPGVAFIVTAQGRVARVLSGLGLNGGDVWLALVEAGDGRVGTFADRVHLLCYGFDPVRGIYTAAIGRLLTAGGLVTVLLLAGGLGFLAQRNRRHA